MYKQSKRRLLKWFEDNDDYNKDYTNSKWLKNPDFQRDFELELIWWLYIVDICHGIGRTDIKKKLENREKENQNRKHPRTPLNFQKRIIN